MAFHNNYNTKLVTEITLTYILYRHRNGQLIMLNEERYEGGTVTKQSLVIKNATREDMGEYQCTLKNSVGSQQSWNTANVNVFCKYLYNKYG